MITVQKYPNDNNPLSVEIVNRKDKHVIYILSIGNWNFGFLINGYM